jgi:hypothetical protein
MPRTRFALAVACVLVILTVVAVFALHARSAPVRTWHSALTDYEQERAYWASRVAAVGGAVAYTEFAQAMVGADHTHDHAHSFGEALYDVEGMDGVAVCDLQFDLGCMHTFFARAVEDHGLGGLPDINAACANAPSPKSLFCHHGIGHGVLAFVGYTFDDLKKTLSLCDGLPNDPLRGCDIGAFMEFSQQSMLGSDALIRDAGRDWLYPCDKVAENDQPVCYFYQPQWWSVALEQKQITGAAAFAKIGELCESLQDANLVKKCIQGAGHMLPFNITREASTAIELCAAMTKDPLHQLYCRDYAANMFFVEDKKDTALAVCDGLLGDGYAVCRAFASAPDPSRLPEEKL